MTVQEACEYLRMPLSTFYYKVKKDNIPVIKQGKHLYIYRDELDKWLESPAQSFEEAAVRAADACEQSPAVLRVDGSVIGTMGNFSASIGKAKSKKTFNVAALTAAALANGTVLHYRASFPEEKRGILYIDTEQGRPQGAELTTARCRSTRHRECLCGCFREICRGVSEKVRVGSF